MMEDKVVLAGRALHKRTMVDETTSKRSGEVDENVINILNTISNEQVKTLGVKDMTITIIHARRIITKHSYIENVKAKYEQMHKSVQAMRNSLNILFQKGLSSFWDNYNKLMPQKYYQEMLIQARMDASNFDDLDNRLTGIIIISKLSDDVEILHKFKVLIHNIPTLSYDYCIELEVLLKEMSDYVVPTYDQWKQVERIGRSKYKLN